MEKKREENCKQCESSSSQQGVACLSSSSYGIVYSLCVCVLCLAITNAISGLTTHIARHTKHLES